MIKSHLLRTIKEIGGQEYGHEGKSFPPIPKSSLGRRLILVSHKHSPIGTPPLFVLEYFGVYRSLNPFYIPTFPGIPPSGMGSHVTFGKDSVKSTFLQLLPVVI